jgi:putative glutamine amidotransferase
MPRIVVSYAKPHKAAKYKDALRAVGGDDVTIVDACSTAPDAAGWAEHVAGADGLLLTGGSDVEPRRSGETEHASARVEADLARDSMEWTLLDAARAAGLPVFGICRGHQVINTYLGGTLWQDLDEAGPALRERHPDSGADRRKLVHEVEITAPRHPLGELIAGGGDPRVNSLHHQAVRTPAPDAIVVAEGPAGIVEALALDAPDWWVWSVQWHPEELVEAGDPGVHRALIEGFLTESRRAAGPAGGRGSRGASP